MILHAMARGGGGGEGGQKAKTFKKKLKQG